jgi:tetratricopeptide (TPR) repeat protein
MTDSNVTTETESSAQLTAFPTEERTEPNTYNKSQRLIIWATLLLLGVPLAWGALQREVAKWHATAAYEASLADKPQLAIEKMDRALAWDANSIDHLVTRCGYKLRSGNAKAAIGDAELALRLARAAAADRLNLYSANNLIRTLNTHAYVLALAEQDLDLALENINEALSMVGQPTSGGMLDTRAYVRYLVGDFEGGLEDAESAVELYERYRRKSRATLRQQARTAIDKRPWDHADQELDEGMAVFYQHRGLLYAATERSEEAEKDFERAAALGYDPAQGVW